MGTITESTVCTHHEGEPEVDEIRDGDRVALINEQDGRRVLMARKGGTLRMMVQLRIWAQWKTMTEEEFSTTEEARQLADAFLKMEFEKVEGRADDGTRRKAIIKYDASWENTWKVCLHTEYRGRWYYDGARTAGDLQTAKEVAAAQARGQVGSLDDE